MSSIAVAYGYLFLGFLCNMITVYSVKKAEGFAVLWPTVIAMITICITQGLLSKAVHAGLDLGLAAALISVAVISGAVVMGVVLFGEHMSVLKVSGLVLAVTGVTIASLAK